MMTTSTTHMLLALQDSTEKRFLDEPVSGLERAVIPPPTLTPSMNHLLQQCLNSKESLEHTPLT